MTESQEEELLEFIRREVIPLLLVEAVPGGVPNVVRRLKREYPALDLFAAAPRLAAEPEPSWICRDCGGQSLAANYLQLLRIGWTALDGDTGRCAPCSQDEDEFASHPLLESSAALVRRARVVDISASRSGRLRTK